MKILISLMCLISVARANVWDGNIDVQQDYACLGLDGIPIANGSALASQCCSDHQLIANAPASCRSGYHSIKNDSGQGASIGVTLANQGLQTSGDLGGNNTDGNLPPNLGATDHGGGTPGSESVASIAGGSAAGDPTSGGLGAGGVKGPGKGGPGRGGMGGGAGGSGLGLSGSGGTSGLKGSDEAGGDKANGGGYVKGGGAGKDGAAGGMFGGMFGGGANGGNTVGAGGANEYAFGEGGETAGGNSASGDGSDDGDGRGTSEDPSDYFSRIDKSASIFKVVSARYMKKKSLWMIPQKLPEKKI